MSKIFMQEYIPNNFLETQVQRCLRPVIACQHVVFQSKYLIRDNFITPNGRAYNAIGFFMTIIFVAALYHSLDYLSDRGLQNAYTDTAPIVNSVTCAVINVFLYTDNIFNADNNVALIVYVQTARRCFRYCKGSLEIVTTKIRAMVTFVVLNGFGIQIAMICFSKWTPAVCVSTLTGIWYDISLVYVNGVLMLLMRNLELWLEELKIRSANRKGINETIFSSTQWYEMQDSFEKLSKAYLLSRKIICVGIVMHLSLNSLNIITFLQMIIEFQKDPTDPAIVLVFEVISVEFIIKNMILICFVSAESQSLYEILNSIHIECLNVIAEPSNSEDQRRICKNVLRIQQANIAKLTPCSMFTLDASLPLNFGQLVTTHLIVLLQLSCGQKHPKELFLDENICA